ncbi:MAG: hypothetical protein U0900_02525 [Myxococcota bacterium]
MVYVLGLGCVAWTIVELMQLARPIPTLARAGEPERSRSPRSGAAPRRAPLAAWDEQGRPIFVEDVSHRGRR